MKILKKILIFVFVCSFMLLAAACGEDPEPDQGGEANKGGTINIFLPIDSDSETAFKNVGNAYKKMKKEQGVDVNVVVRSSQDPQGYYTAVDGLLKNPDKQDGDIIQSNTVSQYYGTGALVDFTPYLNTPNEYNGNKVWKTTLREDAYRADVKTQHIYNLSMEGNAFVAFYNKDTFKKNGLKPPKTWGDFIDILDKLKNEVGYTAPLGMNFDEAGLESNNFNWVLQMYMDQYFRDMIDVAHSKEGDYSRIPEIDDVWQYDPDDPINDSPSVYTYNFTRVVNEYFKDGSTFNTDSARFADLMGNIKELASYASTDYSSSAIRQRFQNDALTVSDTQEYDLNNRVAVYLLRLDYITDHQKSLGQAMGKPNGVVPTEELSDMLGWFTLPAMPDNGGDGAPAADDLRTLGGPDHHPLALVNRDAEKTELCIDFLKYLFSPQGFDEYYRHYKNLGKVCAMQCYLKDYELPAEVSIEGETEFVGDCSTNPYKLFATYYSENSGILATGGMLQDLVNAEISEYLRASSGTAWAAYGEEILRLMKDAFPNYAKWRGLKETDINWYIGSNVNFKTDPMQS